MDEQISAAEAKRKFSKLLRAVCAGRSYIVTMHGKPVAKIAPAYIRLQERLEARKLLLARLQTQSVGDIRVWSRSELYERSTPQQR